ncbi:MAG: Ig-like domain-containing protein, partial [Candidatus Dormibacteraceae bacterium]
DTSTALTTCPTSPVPYGTRVRLTAKVTAATATDTPTGTVTFTDQTTDLPLDTALVGSNGTASVSTEALKAGTHTLTAEFAPADEKFSSSKSPAVTLTVTNTEGSGSPQIVVPQAQPSGQSLDAQPLLEVRTRAVDGRPLINVEEWPVRDRQGWVDALVHVLF